MCLIDRLIHCEYACTRNFVVVAFVRVEGIQFPFIKFRRLECFLFNSPTTTPCGTCPHSFLTFGCYLATLVTVFLLVQQFAYIGFVGDEGTLRSNGDSSPTQEFFGIVNVVNFQVESLKLGCEIGELSFAMMFWVTLALMGGVGLLFMAAVTLRYVHK